MFWDLILLFAGIAASALGQWSLEIGIGGVVICTVISLILFWRRWRRRSLVNTRSGPLAGLTNAQLRERTVSFSAELIKFEQAHDALEPAFEVGEALSREEARESWRRGVQETIRRHDQFAAEYREKYKSDAIILRDELRRRLGDLPMPLSSSPGINEMAVGPFDRQVLAGPHPLAAAAGLLIYWAKHLP